MRRSCGMAGFIGGGDLWHVLSAVDLRRRGADVSLLAYDDGLLKAAGAENITVVDGRRLKPERLLSALQKVGKYAVPAPEESNASSKIPHYNDSNNALI